MQNFWRTAIFPTVDSINDDIRGTSPAIHQQPGFLPAGLVAAGSAGAQQAMLDPAIYPWLPANSIVPWPVDLAGADWTHPDAVIIVGSAPAGFIAGCSSRNRVMNLADYVAAPDWQTFLQRFVDQVVQGDHQFYDRLWPLLNHRSRFAYFDLVRASLVVRGEPAANCRFDANLDTRLPNPRKVYAAHVEHPKSRQWTTDRLLGSGARLLVPLGSTAEYGLVRLVARMGMTVRDSLTGRVWQQPPLHRPENWAYGYAGGEERTLGRRLAQHSWWIAEDPNTGTPRWAIVPVFHPGSWGGDPGYSGSCSLVDAARRAISSWP